MGWDTREELRKALHMLGLFPLCTILYDSEHGIKFVRHFFREKKNEKKCDRKTGKNWNV